MMYLFVCEASAPESSGAASSATPVTATSAVAFMSAVSSHLGELSPLLQGQHLHQRQPEIDAPLTYRRLESIHLGVNRIERLGVGLTRSHLLPLRSSQLAHHLMDWAELLPHLRAQRSDLSALSFVEVQSRGEPATPSFRATVPSLGTGASVSSTNSWSAMPRTDSIAVSAPTNARSSTSMSILGSSLTKLGEPGLLLRVEQPKEGGAELCLTIAHHALQDVHALSEGEDRSAIRVLRGPGLLHLSTQLSQVLAHGREVFPHLLSQGADLSALSLIQIERLHDSWTQSAGTTSPVWALTAMASSGALGVGGRSEEHRSGSGEDGDKSSSVFHGDLHMSSPLQRGR